MSNEALFEIGLEELPARFISSAENQLREKTEEWLEANRLPFTGITVYSTPRRLAVYIEGLPEKQPDTEEKAKGPAEKIAVNEDGEWSKAAVGFSKGQGKTPEDIYFEEVNGTSYAHIDKYIKGEETETILQDYKNVILSLAFPKNMRWGDHSLRFIRPIRWLVALFESTIIPLEIEGVSAGKTTRGHRFLGRTVEIEHPSRYVSALYEQFVAVDRNERKEDIQRQLEQLQQEKNWDIHEDEDLLWEVTDLVEYPTVFSGSFDESFLKVPDEVLITSMKEHQRYFPVHRDDALLPYFVGVRNGDGEHIDNVAKGNEKVLRARLSDAEFFYEEDLKVSIEQRLEKLGKIVYQEELGTLAEKVGRNEDIALIISDKLAISDRDRANVQRAARISKFDLVTQMVDEFTDLQGIMGEKYARIFGETEEVAVAIREQYLPKQAGGAVPETITGAVLSLADKLDTIVGAISVGNLPSGSQDPYGLRRQALGVLKIIEEHGFDINITELLDRAVSYYGEKAVGTAAQTELRANVHEFFNARTAYLLKKEDVESDVVEAVLAEGSGNYSLTKEKAHLLSAKRHEDGFRAVQEAFGRTLNMADKAEGAEVDKSLFEKEEELRLYEKHEEVKEAFFKQLEEKEINASLRTLSELAEPIHSFFDNIMVMAEDESVRMNRLALLKNVADTLYVFADFNAIQWKQQN
ncbi:MULTISPECIES: glycine--tRNA ligase subunit beta [Salimicrobium]|uniref:Glycine--tRNA ligase beta subunit n=1 Tax=Salimicrobium humidisoli TaxID=2029857 RepID=A0ABX4HUI8_9BACI|nr:MULTISPECIES: glycine--tRNA ligase subunit beta [Salimicrobium]PBB06859.1 glycine--tRNA ligase subunit beta [Salimicrobium humidisoli]